MTVLEAVKIKRGIFYSDPIKDAEIEQNIEAAKLFFKSSGWDVDTPNALAIEAIALFCKISENTDPSLINSNPVLISYITQGRMK